MEQSANELVWSVGSKIDSDKVAAAFKLDGKKDLLKRSDAGPVSLGSGMSLRTLIVIFLLTATPRWKTAAHRARAVGAARLADFPAAARTNDDYNCHHQNIIQLF